MSDPSEHTIEPVSGVDPLSPRLFDVFRIVDADGTEVARCFDPRSAALVCAAFNVGAHEPAPLRCPSCLGAESHVVDTRHTASGIARNRKCLACGARYRTVERVVELVSPGEQIDG